MFLKNGNNISKIKRSKVTDYSALTKWDVYALSYSLNRKLDVSSGVVEMVRDVLSGAAEMAWDVLSGVAKTALDVLSGVGKSTWDVLSWVSESNMGCFISGCFVLLSLLTYMIWSELKKTPS